MLGAAFCSGCLIFYMGKLAVGTGSDSVRLLQDNGFGEVSLQLAYCTAGTGGVAIREPYDTHRSG